MSNFVIIKVTNNNTNNGIAVIAGAFSITTLMSRALFGSGC